MEHSYSGIDVLEIMDGAKNYNSYLTDLIISHSPTKKALDFGAGSGAFARNLRDRGFEVVCIEPDSTLKAGLIKEGFTAYSQLSECPDTFNYIYSINVLEHIQEDQQIIEHLQTKLNPGGRLFIYVPAFMVLYSAFDKKIGHIRRYTKTSLLQIVPQLRIEDCYYVDSLGFVAALAFKWIGKKDGSVSLTAIRIFDMLIFPISLILDRVVKPFFGKNVLLVAQKR